MNTTANAQPERRSRPRHSLLHGVRILLHTIGRVILLAIAVWFLWRIVPAAINFVFTQLFVYTMFVVIIIGVHLFLAIAFLFYLMYSFARTAVVWRAPGKTGVDFDTYRGNPAVVAAAQPIVTMLQRVKKTRRRQDSTIHGVVLQGVPGSGKKLLAQTIATEAHVPYGYVNARSLIDGWFGTDNLKVRTLYRKAYRLARTYGACILFIDEIEVLGHSSPATPQSATPHSHDTTPSPRAPSPMQRIRSSISTTSNPFHELLLQMDTPPVPVSWWRQLLLLLPSPEKVKIPLVLTIGATSHAEALDSALLHTGRLDYRITIDPPESAGRYDLFISELECVPHNESIPIERLVQETHGATPAAIRQMVSEAVHYARQEGRQHITYRDITFARLNYEWRQHQPVPNLTYQQRRRMAYHQAGHAYMQAQLMHEPRLTTISVLTPHHTALPFDTTALLPTMTRDEMVSTIQVALAGRVAEEELLGIMMALSAEDLAYASRIAAYMVGGCGTEDHLFSYSVHGQETVEQALINSDLRNRVEHLLQAQYHQVRTQIDQNHETVTAIAEALLLCHTLTDSDIREIVAWVAGRRLTGETLNQAAS